MIISCLHGYFIFREELSGEVAKFNSAYGADLTAKDDYYTFDALVDAPRYSVAGLPYLGLVASETFEAGNPWEVMRQNGLVYDFSTKLFVPAISVTAVIEPRRRYDSFFLNGLIQPGSVTKDWQRVTGYQCQVDIKNSSTFNYSELFYG